MYFTFLTQCPTLLKILAWTWELVTQLPESTKNSYLIFVVLLLGLSTFLQKKGKRDLPKRPYHIIKAHSALVRQKERAQME